jgi:hypothetical protein
MRHVHRTLAACAVAALLAGCAKKDDPAGSGEIAEIARHFEALLGIVGESPEDCEGVIERFVEYVRAHETEIGALRVRLDGIEEKQSAGERRSMERRIDEAIARMAERHGADARRFAEACPRKVSQIGDVVEWLVRGRRPRWLDDGPVPEERLDDGPVPEERLAALRLDANRALDALEEKARRCLRLREEAVAAVSGGHLESGETRANEASRCLDELRAAADAALEFAGVPDDMAAEERSAWFARLTGESSHPDTAVRVRPSAPPAGARDPSPPANAPAPVGARARLAPEVWERMTSASAPSFGPDEAAVTLVWWAGFQCAWSARSASWIEPLRERYRGRPVRVVFRNLPLPQHAGSTLNARAGLAANAQGRFWEYAREAFAGTRERTERADLERFAGGAGLDLVAFRRALDSDAITAAVDADLASATQADIRGTPAFVLEDEVLPGLRGGVEQLFALIDEQLAAPPDP